MPRKISRAPPRNESHGAVITRCASTAAISSSAPPSGSASSTSRGASTLSCSSTLPRSFTNAACNELTALKLVPIETVPVCSPALLTPAFDLRRQRLLHSRQRPQDWRRWLAFAGLLDIDPSGGLFFESIGLALEAAAEGLGVARGIRRLLDGDLSTGRVAIAVPLVRPTRRWFTLIYGAGKIDLALRAFAEWLRDESS